MVGSSSTCHQSQADESKLVSLMGKVAILLVGFFHMNIVIGRGSRSAPVILEGSPLRLLSEL